MAETTRDPAEGQTSTSESQRRPDTGATPAADGTGPPPLPTLAPGKRRCETEVAEGHKNAHYQINDARTPAELDTSHDATPPTRGICKTRLAKGASAEHDPRGAVKRTRTTAHRDDRLHPHTGATQPVPMGTLMDTVERTVMTGEAQSRRCPSHPPAPRGPPALVEECKRKMHGATWPQHNDDVPLFRTRMRRLIDTIVKAHGGTVVSYIWLALAWVKQKGHVPSGVNRTESSRTVPFWASEVL